jgi:cytidylate kinase
MLEGEDVSQAIRSETAGEAASQVAAVGEVREALLTRQRAFASAPGLVADGRDMGTVVFPQALLKVYLTASAEVRAQRRLKQLKDHGLNANLAGLVSDIQERDARDMNREHSPLRPASDAVTIDTSALTIDEVVTQVLSLFESRKP